MSEWPLAKRQQITSVGEGVKKRETLCTVGAATREIAERFLKKLRTKLPYYSAIPLLGIYLANK